MDLEENYLIARAKSAQSTDPNVAKAWIFTAKALYPNNFGVQVLYFHILFLFVTSVLNFQNVLV